MDIEKIKQLRNLIDISLNEAKELLQQCANNVDLAYQQAKERRLRPLMKKIGVTMEDAHAAYEACHGDQEKALARLQYRHDPEAYHKKHRPRLTDFLAGISNLLSVYDVCEACDIDQEIWTLETSDVPDVIQRISYLLTFYALYRTDHDLLFSEYREAHHPMLEAVACIMSPPIVEMIRADFHAKAPDHYEKFLDSEDLFLRHLKQYIKTHRHEIFRWRYRY